VVTYEELTCISIKGRSEWDAPKPGKNKTKKLGGGAKNLAQHKGKNRGNKGNLRGGYFSQRGWHVVNKKGDLNLGKGLPPLT